jgi:cell division protein FtsB
MKPLNQEFYDSKHHASNDDLIDYMGGRLAEPAHERIQSHLVECDECLDLFRDVRDFFESHRGAEPLITGGIANEWQALWKRITDEEGSELRTFSGRQKMSWASSSASWALAAMLLVVLGIGILAVMQRRQKQQLVMQLETVQQQTAALQTEQQNLVNRTKQLEQENFQLQERARSAPPSRDAQSVEIRRPELNAPIYDLYAQNFIRRSAVPGEANRIKLPPSANSMVLVLNGEGIPPASSYGIEILSSGGQVIWRAKGLKRDRLGNFTLTIDRSFLGKGTYRLRLDSKPLAEYPMVVE